MFPLRLIRSGLLLAGLLATFGATLQATVGGFTATLSTEERAAAGLTALNTAELIALDALVADDLARARELRVTALPGTLGDRHADALCQAAGLDRLTPEQRAKLDALVADALAARPLPKDRPRLRDRDLLSDQGRLRVHGGMSFTVGGGGGGSFHGSSAWVSYYDPVTGLGLGFAYSQLSGDGLWGAYPGYGDSPRPIAAPVSYYSAAPRLQFARAGADRSVTPTFIRGGSAASGGAGRGPLSAGRGSRH